MLKSQGKAGCISLNNYSRCISSKQMLSWRYFRTYELRDVSFQGHFLDFWSSEVISKCSQFRRVKNGPYLTHNGSGFTLQPVFSTDWNLREMTSRWQNELRTIRTGCLYSPTCRTVQWKAAWLMSLWCRVPSRCPSGTYTGTCLCALGCLPVWGHPS